MKKFRLLLCGLMVAGVAFTSCSDDDGDAPAQQASITGKWYYSQRGLNAAGQDMGFSNYSEHATGCTKDNMELTEGGAWREYDYTSAPACTESVETSTYTRTANSITFGTGEGADTWEIESVTDNTLRLRQLYTASEAGNVYSIETYTRN